MSAHDQVTVELIGISGAGKSTLAESLTRELNARGVNAVATRRETPIKPTMAQKLNGAKQGLREAANVASCFLSHGGMTRSCAGRLRRGARGAIWFGGIATDRIDVAIIEPGWLMQFVGLCMQQRRAPDSRICDQVLDRMIRPDILAVLDNSVDVSLSRMEGRQRGLPRSMQALDTKNLIDGLECGRAACTALAEAARRRGVRTYRLAVSDLPADQVVHAVLNDAILPVIA